MISNGSCEDVSDCSDENCRYCGSVRGKETCFECFAGYVLLVENENTTCKKEKETTKNCWLATASNVE